MSVVSWRQSSTIGCPALDDGVARAQALRSQQLQIVAHAEGHAFHHGPHHVSQAVAQREADESAARQRVWMRVALATQPGCEQQTLCACRHLSGQRAQLIKTQFRRQGIPQPAQPARRAQHNAHAQPGTRHRATEGV